MTTFAEMLGLCAAGKPVLPSSQVDVLYNPVSHGLAPYADAERDYLYALPPVRTSNLVVYGIPGEDLAKEIVYRERSRDGRLLRHVAKLSTSLMQDIYRSHGGRPAIPHMLVVPYGSYGCTGWPDDQIRVELASSRGVAVLPIKPTSGWHGIHRETGLPHDDGRGHNGHNGHDRYLWRLSGDDLRARGSNGYFGSPVHLLFSPRFYGQNVIVAFGMTTLASFWVHEHAEREVPTDG